MNEVEALLRKLAEAQRARRAAPEGSDERWNLFVQESALWTQLRKERKRKWKGERNEN